MRYLITIAILALFLVACTKEEVVVPGRQTHSTVPSADDMTKGSDDGGATEPGTEGQGISDDGDDLNDGEGRRKKKKP